MNHVPSVQHWTFPASTEAVAAARNTVADAVAIAGYPELVEPARLIVGELASNSVLHAASPFHVRVSCQPPALRIEIADDSGIEPTLRSPEPERPGGRGMMIVAALASSWGTISSPAGKTVWVELACG